LPFGVLAGHFRTAIQLFAIPHNYEKRCKSYYHPHDHPSSLPLRSIIGTLPICCEAITNYSGIHFTHHPCLPKITISLLHSHQ
jgi:hypothetical protein